MKTIAPETRQALQLLRDAHQAGQFLSYEDIEKAIGFDPRTNGRNYVKVARELAQRDYGAIFSVVHGRGFQPLTADQILGEGSESRKRQIVGTMKRWRGEVETIDSTSLNPGQQKQYAQRCIEMTFVEATLSEESERLIHRKVAEQPNPVQWFKNRNILDEIFV